MLGELITSKTRLRLLIKFFVSQANKGHLNGLANEMGESTNGIRKELNHLEHAGYLKKLKVSKTLDDVCEYPEGIDISYNENLIVVACWFEDNIILIDLNNGSLSIISKHQSHVPSFEKSSATQISTS